MPPAAPLPPHAAPQQQQALDLSPVAQWMLARGLPWDVPRASHLARSGVSCVEQLKLLSPGEWEALFVGEPDILRRHARAVYYELIGTGPFDARKCVAEAAAAVGHPVASAEHHAPALAVGPGVVVAPVAPSLHNDMPTVPQSHYCGLIAEPAGACPDRPSSAPLANETFRSEDIFGLSPLSASGKESVVLPGSGAIFKPPMTATGGDVSLRKRAAHCGFSESFLASMTDDQVLVLWDLYHSIYTSAMMGKAASQTGGLASMIQGAFAMGLSNCGVVNEFLASLTEKQIQALVDLRRSVQIMGMGKRSGANGSHGLTSNGGVALGMEQGASDVSESNPSHGLKSYVAPLENETFRGDEIFGLSPVSANGKAGVVLPGSGANFESYGGVELKSNGGLTLGAERPFDVSGSNASHGLKSYGGVELKSNGGLALGADPAFEMMGRLSSTSSFGMPEEVEMDPQPSHAQPPLQPVGYPDEVGPKSDEGLATGSFVGSAITAVAGAPAPACHGRWRMAKRRSSLDSHDAPLDNETFQGDEIFGYDDHHHDATNVPPPPPRPDPQQPYKEPNHVHPLDPVMANGFAPTPPPPTVAAIPLRQWTRNEALSLRLSLQRKRQSIVRKTTVAYGMAELLRHALGQRGNGTGPSLRERCTPDDFVVRVADAPDAPIEGIDWVSAGISIKIITPFFLSDEYFDGGNGSNDGDDLQELGQFLEVEIVQPDGDAAVVAEAMAALNQSEASFADVREENAMCHLFGVLLYEMYSEMHPFKASASEGDNEMGQGLGKSSIEDGTVEGPRRKKSNMDMLSLLDDEVLGGTSPTNAATVPYEGKFPSKVVPLSELGFPASISLLVKNLLECGWEEFTPDDAILSLKEASDDLHLLLEDPGRFLFDGNPEKGVSAALNIKQNKLYGRDSERSLINDVFCRVSLTGETEALLIEGFSGSGKSRLVQSVVEYVDVAGAYIVHRKFDQISQERSLAVIISGFNELCTLISEKRSPKELHAIVTALMGVFGAQLSTLARVLPNVTLLSPALNAVSQDECQITEINLSRTCSILQLFVRVVSSREHPIMLFLDDLHWGDSASFDLLAEVLSDIKGCSCVYFVGSYRSNEVPGNHPIFKFISSLEACHVGMTRVRLDGMGIEDVNHMVSDALGTFPRICRPLSRIVLRRTEGNPLFVLECLRSLVDKDLLHYSFRERCWVWDIDKIGAEDIAENVCLLLSTKMAGLPESSQMALKIASCFGSTVVSQVVETLASASSDLSTFRQELENAVVEGFMNKDGPGYRFAHDKVREAAYSLIEDDARGKFHHDIGMLLYSATKGQSNGDTIFLIVDQINQGDIEDPTFRVKIAELNHRAASKSMGNLNFAAAYFYSNAAINLLPRDCWESSYELSRNIFLVMGNAALSEGHIEVATSALGKILTHGRSLEDKLDAYYLKISLLHSRQEGKPAYDTCVEVLTQLGEAIPTTLVLRDYMEWAKQIQTRLSEMTEEDFMDREEMTNPLHLSLMQFYSLLGFISYFVNPPMLKWYACKLVELSLEHGVCKFTALGLVRFAMVLQGRLIDDIEEGYRVGKISLKLMERFDATELLPSVYITYYGYIAVHVEPFQSCAAMLKRGYEIGLSTGDIQTALLEGISFIQKSFASGTNLLVLKKECDHQLRLIDAHSQTMTKMYTSAFQETISMIIGKEACAPPSQVEGDDPSNVAEFSASVTFHHVLQNFWMGRYGRCLYYAEKSSAASDISQLKNIIIMFYRALSSLHNSGRYNTKAPSKKLITFARNAVEVMKGKGENSSWNYRNKIQLLTAQLESVTDKKDQAKLSFNAAITSARSSKFTHEQGLACELAAIHCLKHSDHKDAMNLFEQARTCYQDWGSQVKVDSVTAQMEKVAVKMASCTPNNK